MRAAFPRLVLPLILLTAPMSSPPQQNTLGIFDGQTDVGTVSRPGTVTYDAATQRYLVAGSGANMWMEHDDFHFVWKRLSGDFILNARMQLQGKGVDLHRKIGWTVRSTLDRSSPQVTAVVHGDGLMAMQFRRTQGAITDHFPSPTLAPDVIQLERRAGKFYISSAHTGDTLTTEQVADVVLPDTVYVGLFICAHNDSVTETALFKDVRITIPAKPNFVPYRDYIGSHLELMDVATGDRQIIHSEKGSIQAPNWTRDNKSLIYNGDGKLFRYDLATNTPSVLNTGTVTRNNNDHVLSFDGRQLGISSAEGTINSIIYTVPVEGGIPTKVTPTGPSYLHGWSPDAKTLVFAGQRNGKFDIYQIPVTGGAEKKLTDSKGVNDGPEYTPDGTFIYFNSARTGRMQIWRMKPDGSDQEQVTNDRYNNWFPHISPDGRWIVFVAFPGDIDPDTHPFYKMCYIQIMPVSGGAPRVIAYLYGGQGTINVPSWSPDSRKVAFVSNTVIR